MGRRERRKSRLLGHYPLSEPSGVRARARAALDDSLRKCLRDVIGRARVNPQICRERLERIAIAADRIRPTDLAVRPICQQLRGTCIRQRSSLRASRMIGYTQHRQRNCDEDQQDPDPHDRSTDGCHPKVQDCHPPGRKRRENGMSASLKNLLNH